MLKKAWWKKRNWTHEGPKYSKKKNWTHEGPSIQRKKKRERDSPCPKKEMEREREMVHERSLKHHPYKIKIFTLAHLDQGLWLVSPSDPIFDLATNEEQVFLRLFPDPKLHISLFRGRWKKGNTLPWWGIQKAKREIWENKLRS